MGAHISVYQLECKILDFRGSSTNKVHLLEHLSQKYIFHTECGPSIPMWKVVWVLGEASPAQWEDKHIQLRGLKSHHSVLWIMQSWQDLSLSTKKSSNVHTVFLGLPLAREVTFPNLHKIAIEISRGLALCPPKALI